MKKHEILSPHSRAALFDPPTDPTAIVRHYTVSPQDLTLILRRRRDPNRLGFAVHLAYLRSPGRVLGAQKDPPSDMLAFIASQIGVAPEVSPAIRGAMKPGGPHLGEIQTYLGVRSFQRGDYRGIPIRLGRSPSYCRAGPRRDGSSGARATDRPHAVLFLTNCKYVLSLEIL